MKDMYIHETDIRRMEVKPTRYQANRTIFISSTTM